MRPTRHKPKFRTRACQRGAVLLLVTFSLVALFGLAALVLDFGRLYIIESQLQNAADAGALRGAKELDGTAAKLVTACNEGVEGALTNRFLLAARELAASDLTVEVSSRPYGASWVTLKSAGGSCGNGGVAGANNFYFMRVTADASNVPSLLGGVLGIWRDAARALAVAGRYNVEITPIAMCLLDADECPDRNPNGECGYVRGKGYKVSDINPLGPGTPYWVDPVATSTPCSSSDTDDFRPYICQGKVAYRVSVGGTVYTNTGTSTPALAALDSRFGDYDAQGQCEPATAPPDTNVKEYRFEDQDGNNEFTWMSQRPGRQAACVTSGTSTPVRLDSQGVLWAGSRHDQYAGVPMANRPADLPPDNPYDGRTANANYPATGTPYSQTSDANFFRAPTGQGAPYRTAGRRLLNLLIVNCPSGGGLCRPATVKGVGRFLLVRKANDSFGGQAKCDGSPGSEPAGKDIYVEFVRMLSVGEIEAEIKLYR